MFPLDEKCLRMKPRYFCTLSLYLDLHNLPKWLRQPGEEEEEIYEPRFINLLFVARVAQSLCWKGFPRIPAHANMQWFLRVCLEVRDRKIREQDPYRGFEDIWNISQH